jgi:hypothetical protein
MSTKGSAIAYQNSPTCRIRHALVAVCGHSFITVSVFFFGVFMNESCQRRASLGTLIARFQMPRSWWDTSNQEARKGSAPAGVAPGLTTDPRPCKKERPAGDSQDAQCAESSRPAPTSYRNRSAIPRDRTSTLPIAPWSGVRRVPVVTGGSPQGSHGPRPGRPRGAGAGGCQS